MTTTMAELERRLGRDFRIVYKLCNRCGTLFFPGVEHDRKECARRVRIQIENLKAQAAILEEAWEDLMAEEEDGSDSQS